jgi:hypothetical protein
MTNPERHAIRAALLQLLRHCRLRRPEVPRPAAIVEENALPGSVDEPTKWWG